MRQKGDTYLDLNTQATRALTTLPDSIKTLTHLQELFLNNLQVGDAGLKHIAALTNLQGLHLDDTQVGDAGLKHIAALTNLQILLFDNTQVGDAGLKHIAALTNLQELYLDNMQVGDAGLKHIAALTNLQRLDLDNTQVSDAGLKHIAALTNLQDLYLDSTQVGDAGLKHITTLTNLQTLRLHNTQVGDVGLKHITALTNLQTLYLDNTRIRDLRPLTRLTKLADKDGLDVYGLHFQNTPACDLDPQIKTLSEIKDGRERTAALFDYLNGLTDWPPLPETPIPQDAVLSVVQTPDGQLDVAPATPDETELHDPVKQHLHTFLKSASQALADAAGNMYPRLATTARDLLAMLDQPLDQIDLLAVHLQLEDLRGTFERRGERVGEDILSADVVDALDKVVKNGPGLTLDNAVVEALEKRKARYATPPDTPDLQPAQDAVSDAIVRDPTLFGGNIRGYSVTFKHNSGNTDRMRAGQDTLNKNTVIKTGTKVALWLGGTVTTAVVGWGSIEGIKWLAANSEAIATLAASWGPSFEAWITPILMRAQQAYDATRAVIRRL